MFISANSSPHLGKWRITGDVGTHGFWELMHVQSLPCSWLPGTSLVRGGMEAETLAEASQGSGLRGLGWGGGCPVSGANEWALQSDGGRAWGFGHGLAPSHSSFSQAHLDLVLWGSYLASGTSVTPGSVLRVTLGSGQENIGVGDRTWILPAAQPPQSC